MKVIIIEDELPAQAKLELMMRAIDPAIQVVARLASVKETLMWLEKNQEPDLAFVDIQLSDDHSFEIFRQHPVKFPVIFTTAYDKFMLESFEFNSVDYLLKPITEEKLRRSLEKVQNLKQHFLTNNLLKLIELHGKPNVSRLVARKGTEFVALNLDEAAYFFTDHKIVFVRDFSGRQMIVDKNMSELEAALDPHTFFRINRKFIVHQKAIERFRPDNGKIQIFLKPEIKEEVHVSKETAPEFRRWIGS
jgi:DNA-binding LytR/AlgR family response regulator